MSIRAVFRVRCDGPCQGWLSRPKMAPWGRDIAARDLITTVTAERAEQYPGERAARISAQGAGWSVDRDGRVMCPRCGKNPLGIQLPSTHLQYVLACKTSEGRTAFWAVDVEWKAFKDPMMRKATEDMAAAAWALTYPDRAVERRLWLSMPSQTIVWEGT